MAKKKTKKKQTTKKNNIWLNILFWTILNPFLWIFLLIFGVYDNERRIDYDRQLLNTQNITKYVETNSSKYKIDQMLKTVVKIDTILGIGSGVIIHQDKDNNYSVITNWHVVNSRLTSDIRIDGLRGSQYVIKDNPLNVHYFLPDKKEPIIICGTVVAESQELDLAIVVFQSDLELNIANILNNNSINVFDSVYAVGCQLGGYPIPTQGIISRIINEKYFVGFSNSAQITLGSSGGGVFKKYKDTYYLIGVSNMVATSYYQYFPHYAYAISMQSISQFLVDNDLDYMLY